MGGINKEELLHKESPISLTKTKLLHQNQKHFREKHLAFIFKVGGEGGGVHEKNVNVFKFPQKWVYLQLIAHNSPVSVL